MTNYGTPDVTATTVDLEPHVVLTWPDGYTDRIRVDQGHTFERYLELVAYAEHGNRSRTIADSALDWTNEAGDIPVPKPVVQGLRAIAAQPTLLDTTKPAMPTLPGTSPTRADAPANANDGPKA